MEPKLAVVSLWAEDVKTAARFYREGIGLKAGSHHGPRPHFNLGGVYLTILKGRPSPPQDATPSRFPLLAFSVEDLGGEMARLKTHAVEFPWEVEEDASSRWVMFHDPAGNLIEFVEFS